MTTEASYLSIEQNRRRDRNSLKPREHYELAEVPHENTDDARRESIACRVLFVFSTADQKVVGRVITPTRLTGQQRAILNRLKFPSPAQSLSRRLNPVPEP